MSLSEKRIGWVITAFFIVADMVGSGVVAIPIAFLKTGLCLGIMLMLVISSIFGYTGYLLGQNWIILLERWPSYKNHCRKPYVEIASKSMGKTMKLIASLIVYVTLFGTAVVYILLSTKIFDYFLYSYLAVRVNFCYLLCIVSLAIMPVTYLKSPAHFWGVIVFAMLCTISAVVLIAFGITEDAALCHPEVSYPPVYLPDAILSFGTFLFAFSGHHCFPTIQADMEDARDFPKSVTFGFIMVAILYMPLSVFGYTVYGDSMSDSVIDSVQNPWIRESANLAIAVHCILTLIIMANPLSQQLEEFFKAPHSFGVERVLIRSALLAVMLFCALTIPDFGPFMNLVGSTTIPAVSAILPCICNLYLNAAYFDKKRNTYIIPTLSQVIERTNKVKLVWTSFIICLSVSVGLVAAYMSLNDIFNVNFTPPCYLRYIFPSNTTLLEDMQVNCCGKFRNLNRYGNATDMCRFQQI
uniref:Aa_trans domain-containing protein n=1 Tax=Syphacia muris TaxID=451379 RepID=A0A0N5AUC9_9BILA